VDENGDPIVDFDSSTKYPSLLPCCGSVFAPDMGINIYRNPGLHPASAKS